MLTVNPKKEKNFSKCLVKRVSFLFLSTKLFYVQLKPSSIPFLFFNKQQEPATQKQFPCKISTLKKKANSSVKKLLLLFSKLNKKHSRSQFLFLQARKNSFSRKRVSLSAQNKFGRLVLDNATFLSLASRFWHKAKRKGEPYKQHNQFVPFFSFVGKRDKLQSR